MKKNTIIAFVAVFICTMLVPQTIVAKEKWAKSDEGYCADDGKPEDGFLVFV